MIKRALVLGTMLFACGNAVAGSEISGVNLPDSITLQDKVLSFNGAGVRSKFFIDLYVGSLFTVGQVDQASKVIDSDQPAAIRLNITSGMITSEKMTDAMNEGFDRATDGDPASIQESITEFIATFAEPIKEGDQFTLMSVPGEGIISYKNGKQLSVTRGETFRKAVMAIWLGKNPTDEDLKEDMLKS